MIQDIEKQYILYSKNKTTPFKFKHTIYDKGINYEMRHANNFVQHHFVTSSLRLFRSCYYSFFILKKSKTNYLSDHGIGMICGGEYKCFYSKRKYVGINDSLCQINESKCMYHMCVS